MCDIGNNLSLPGSFKYLNYKDCHLEVKKKKTNNKKQEHYHQKILVKNHGELELLCWFNNDLINVFYWISFSHPLWRPCWWGVRRNMNIAKGGRQLFEVYQDEKNNSEQECIAFHLDRTSHSCCNRISLKQPPDHQKPSHLMFSIPTVQRTLCSTLPGTLGLFLARPSTHILASWSAH